MPTYVYRVTTLPENDPAAWLEVRQSIHDTALERHPETGEPMERVICAPALLGGASVPTATATAPKAHSHGPGCGCH